MPKADKSVDKDSQKTIDSLKREATSVGSISKS